MTKKKTAPAEPEQEEQTTVEEAESADEEGFPPEDDGEDDSAADEAPIPSGSIEPAFKGERHVLIVEPDEERRKRRIVRRFHDPTDPFPLYEFDVLDIRRRLIVFPHLKQAENHVEFIRKIMRVGAH